MYIKALAAQQGYSHLRHRKSAEYRWGNMKANQSDFHKLWLLVDHLLEGGHTPHSTLASSAIDDGDFSFCWQSPQSTIQYTQMRQRQRSLMCQCATLMVTVL